MRIAVLSTLYPTAAQPLALGGAETFVVRLCEELAGRGHAVTAIRAGGVGAAWPDETRNGVSVRTVPVRNFYDPWRARPAQRAARIAWHLREDRGRAHPEARRILAEARPDLLHTHNLPGLTADMWRVAAELAVPVVHTLHDYYLVCVRAQRFRGTRRCGRTCLACRALTARRRTRSAGLRHVVGVSRRVLDIHLAEGLFPAASGGIVIRNAPPPAAEAPRAGRSDGPVVFGFIGRVSVHKGVPDLLAAFARLPAGTARLLVAGDLSPELGPEFERLAARSGAELLGRVEPAAFYRRVDVTVVPSLWDDPSPLVIGESLAFGRPVLGSRRGGIPEILDPRAGWLFEPGGDALFEAMRTIVERPEEIAERVSAVAEVAAAAPSFGDQVTAYEELYRQARSTRPR